MPSCSAINCTNRDVRENREKGLTFHRFPRCNPDRLRQWLINMRRDRWMPTARSVLCSKHFTAQSFHTFGLRVKLRDSAVPTIFDLPRHLQKKVNNRKCPAVRISTPPLREPDLHSCPLPQQNAPVDPLAEHNYATMDSPRKLKHKLDKSIERLEICQKKMKVVHQRTRRFKRKVVL
uniref:THAP domain-containing protein 6-like n=1 Tax=Myxine glutinosa TaxID=7769 RepID=UPI00358F8B22